MRNIYCWLLAIFFAKIGDNWEIMLSKLQKNCGKNAKIVSLFEMR